MQRSKRNWFWQHVRWVVILALIVTALAQLSGSASAHNLNASAVYVFFDPDTQAMLDARIESPTWTPPTPLLLNGDELGLIIKIVPDAGTTTGVGGYTTFYIPDGLQVLDAAFLMPGNNPADGITGYDRISTKGQAQMPAVGAGGEPTVSLVGITRGPNILGVTSPIVTAANTNLGTLPGVYGDTGIFYSISPETAYGTYVGGELTNNSGDIVGARTDLGTALNLWDTWQLAAFGIKASANPSYPASPLVDSNGRGYAPWGFANAVAGPQSGYAWGFDFATYAACDPTPTTTPLASCIDTATQNVGPWLRIKYSGSQFSDDPPGANPPVQPYTRGADASNSGFDLTTGDLPMTTGQSNGTPNAVRWAFGQLTYNTPEWAWIKVKVHDNSAILDPSGCPVWHADTFGGDAGGESGGKDHIWRYYDPNSVLFSGCLGVGKPANREVVKVGDTFQYQVRVYNMGATDVLNVVVRDTLPSGAAFISAVPAANSGPNPLQWNVGTLQQGEKFEATVTVKATASGVLVNDITVTGVTPGGDPVASSGRESTPSGNIPLLSQRKSVSPTSIAPGGTVQYTITIDNLGSGPSGNPVVITEFLPTGFTYVGPLVNAILNGANVTGSTTVNASNPAQPVFTVPGVINAGQSLVLTFNALVSATQEAGSYCNSFRSTQNGINLVSGSEACVAVGGGRIGDTVYRDWDGDGVQDAQDEGLAGVTVNLYAGACPPSGAPIQTKTTDASGQYVFAGLTAGSYCVDAPTPGTGGVPAGYALTTANDPTTVTLATDEQRLDVDFGYEPGGTGSIGDQVFSDLGNDGVFDAGTDVGIPGVTINLYEDTNGNGVIDAEDALIAADVTDANGVYGFTGLDTTRSYLVQAVDGPGSAVDAYFADPYISTTGNPVAVTPTDFTNSGGNVTEADLGYFGLAPATINGAVCTNADSDLDCDLADGDSFLPFVTVYLYKDVNGNGVVDAADMLIQTTTTDPDGTYTFTGVGPGDYVVMVDNHDPDVPHGYFPQVLDVAVDNLMAGETRSQIDFPFATLLNKSVSAETANPGDPLTFSITANYPGDALLNNVTVTDPVPVGLNNIVPGQGGAVGPYVPIPGTPGYVIISGSPVNVTLSPTQDMYIDRNSSSRNYGTCTVLHTDREGENSLLQFDLSGIPAGAEIVSAELILTKIGGSTSTFNVETYRTAMAWVEGAFCDANGIPNWSDPWANDGGDWLDADGVAQGTAPYWSTEVNADGAYSWDMVQMVQEWLAGANNYGVLLETLETGGNQFLEYASSENATVGNRPILVISYIESDSTGNSLSTSAATAATGDTIQVTMQLTSTFNVANVMPSAMTLSGGPGSCVGPLETTPITVQAGIPETLTWNCTLTGEGTYSFSASATNGVTNFATAKSPSVLVTVSGSTQVVTWDLGSNTEGIVGQSFTGGTQPGIYAFRGDRKPDFWRYETTTNAWSSLTTPPANIGSGGALVWDGADFLYALRGDGQKNLYRYSISGGAWTTLASLTVNVKDGGALVKLGNYLYAFQGDRQISFFRYDIAGNSWSAMASAPDKVGKGGALITDGTYIYGLQGDGKTGFWRYNVAANSWSAMASTPVNMGSGGALTRNGNYIYALQGGGKTGFYRYDITANTWTARAVTLGNVSDGGALTNDGTYVYAFQGKTMTFWRYDIATNSWQARASVAANTGLGAALAFVPGTASVARSTTLSAANTLVNSGAQIQVTMALFSNAAVANATPGVLTVTPTGGANVTPANCGSPTPASQNIAANTTVYFTWTCTANAGGVPGSLKFAAGATGDGGATTFASGTSNSVLVIPTLTFTAQVDNPAPVDVIENSAFIADSTGNLPPTESNPTYTALSASIGDLVWLDLDGDGVQDADETGLGGVEVCATNGVDIFCDVTEADGSYRIFGVSTGTWTVTSNPATYPAGFQPTTPTSVTAIITAPTQFFDTADFGLRPPGDGSIGDTIWIDADEDGVVDAGEAPLPGVTLHLYKDDGDGVPEPGELIAVTTTDVNGNYLFDGLYADDYLVVVDPTSPVTTEHGVTTTLGDAMEVVSEGGSTGGVLDGVYAVTLPTDSSDVDTADIGYNWSGQIGNYVWFDTNVNGLQDEVPPTPIEGAQVHLYYDANDNGIVDPEEYSTRHAITYTDANGNYQFENVPPGNYLVDIYEDSITSDGVRDIVPTTPDPLLVQLGPGESYQDADFGYYQGALVQGNVFWDEDRNGLFEAGETGLSPVTVYLTPEPDIDLGNGPGQPITTTTDADGHFMFQVPVGNYTLTYSSPDVLSLDPTLGDATTATSYSFEAFAGEDWQAVFNFGVDNSGSIGDTVYNDANGNGVQNPGEPGLADATVLLYRDNDNDGALSAGDEFVAAEVTDEFGNYLFVGVSDDQYLVIVDTTTTPVGYTPTADPDEAGACTTCDSLGVATVSGGGNDLSLDFGYRAPVVTYTIGGVIWDDLDGDGVREGGEPILPGVTVIITCDTGTYTAVTDGSGAYSVSGIESGSDCTIDVDETTLPNTAYQATTPDTITLTNITANSPNNDFGFQQVFGSISGSVCAGDGNGLCDPGNPPLSPITVTLTYAGADGILGTPDDVTTDATTDLNGDYAFTNLMPGLYTIVQTNLPGYTSLNDADGLNPDIIDVALGVGVDEADQDFEDDLPVVLAAIGNSVWIDENADGIQDAGEPGLANVVVELRDSTGATVIMTTTTDLNGGYVFTDVPPGTYQVVVDGASLPAGLFPTVAGAAGADYNNQPQPYMVTVAAGEESMTADFGYTWADPADINGNTGNGALGDRVWIDADGDGVQDPGEPGLPGATVQLYTDPDGDGVYDTPFGAPAITEPDGSYIFTNLPPDGYVVGVTAPAGYTPTSGPIDEVIPLAPGDVYLNADFGFQPSIPGGVIGDTIWFDLDGDGVQDVGEPGIPGVTIALLNAGGNVIATTTTDANGNYRFTGLPDGTYTVWVNDTNHILGELAPTGDADGVGTPDTSTTAIMGGSLDDAQDFGYAPPDHGPGDGLIGDTIYLDRDGSGAPDPGEGLEGVVINLYDSTGLILLATTITDENGNYSFGDLPASTYLVKVDVSTLPNGGVGLSNTLDPDGGTANQSTVVLASGAVNLVQDFGYTAVTAGEIGGSIWSDTDADGLLDETGNGLAGVTVALFSDPDGIPNNGDEVLVGTTTTDANGDYSFTGLPAGDYLVKVTDSDGVLDGTWHSLGVAGLDGNSQSDPYAVSLLAGQTNTTADFGYYSEPAAVGDFVWNDLDGDGIQDAGEAGLSGVQVDLIITYPDGSVVTLTTTTGAGGSYTFDNLLLDEDFDGVGAGEPTYVIQFEQPAGYAPSPTNQGGDPAQDSNGLTDTVTVTQGQVNDSVDSGFVQLAALGAIGNSVWIDENGNGVQDAGESGLANVVVELYDSSATLVGTTLTDLNGNYLFSSLPPGDYWVQVDSTSLPTGLLPTVPGVAGADYNNQSQPYSVTVTAGAEDMTADFGYTWVDPANIGGNTGNGALGDRVWIDADGDGVQDPGEPGLPGATVQLYTDPDGDGVYDTPFGAPVITGPDGSYIFTNLPPDGYVVGVTPPPGYAATSGPIGEVIPLSPGDVYLNADFGFQPTGPAGTIGDAIWLDANGNGVLDGGEYGIAGVTVALLDAGGNVIATTTTDANGNYSFAGLPDGSYTVWVNDTNHVLGEVAPTFDADGTGTPNRSTTTITGGSVDDDQDFGYAPAGQMPGEGLIGDTIYLDSDGSGAPEPGEGLEGVTIVLLDNLGNVIATTTTDENGHYAFGNLPDGAYTVQVDTTTLPGGGVGMTNSVDPDGGVAGEADVVISGGNVDLAQDFGYTANDPATLSGTIWEDADADGFLDETGAGLAGVTVALFDSDGNIVATTTTDANGDYSFEGVPPGTYTVKVTDEADLLNGYWHSLGTPTVDNNSQSDPYTVTLVAGATNTTADFGYYVEPAGLGDYVWNDLNSNGLQDGGEYGLSGVTVTLRIDYPGGSVVMLTTKTDTLGHYSFPNLLLDENFDGAGVGEPTYTLTFSQPVDATASPTNQGGDDTKDSDGMVTTPTLTQGVNDDTHDMGFIFAPTAVHLQRVTVNGQHGPLLSLAAGAAVLSMAWAVVRRRRRPMSG